MNYIYTIILFFLGLSCSYAQNKINAYEYWFNNDYVNKTFTPITPSVQLTINQNISTAGLPQGFHSFNFRALCDSSRYSSVISSFFYKLPIQNNSTPQIIAYEYWLNNDYSNVVSSNVTAQPQININQLISMATISDGMHSFNIRFKHNKGMWSSVVSEFFYKLPIQSITNPQIIAYEYWLDNDYSNVVSSTVTAQPQININQLISMTTISDGMHSFNIRFKDNKGMWSSVVSEFFYKLPSENVSQNLITNYRYWVDTNFTNVTNVALSTPIQQLNLINNIDFKQIPKGLHTINFQFKDTLGLWSVVTTDTILKHAFPIANFSYNNVVNCDSTVVTFNDLSIDGDTYLWNFGNGNYDSTANPTHTYYSPGIYTVMLTVTDTASQLDSTYQQTITIIGNTSDSIVETACNSYTSPSGNYQYVTSGIYKDTIPNQYACDSIITINLTINTVDTAVSANDPILTSNATSATYQWIDCNNNYSFITGETNQTFTATTNGSYAVIVTQNGCTDTSACYSITSIGIEETNLAEVKIYPNPTSGLIYIDFNNSKNVDVDAISISNLIGQNIYHQNITNEKNVTVNINHNKGVYLVTIHYSNNKKKVYKIIKH